MTKNQRKEHVRAVRRVPDSLQTLSDYTLGLPEKKRKKIKHINTDDAEQQIERETGNIYDDT